MTEMAISPISDAIYLAEMDNSIRMSLNNIQNLTTGLSMTPKFRERYEQDLLDILYKLRKFWRKVADDLGPVIKVCEDRIGDLVTVEFPEVKE